MSRKRKKKSGKSFRSTGSARIDQGTYGLDPGGPDHRDFAAVLGEFAANREQDDRQRAAWAASRATGLVTDLVRVVADQPDVVVEDALCVRLGALLDEAAGLPVDEVVGPRHLAEAVVKAAAVAVEETIGDRWSAPWRVLTAVAGVLPNPHGEAAVAEINRLRRTVGRRVLPAAPPGPKITGPVLWTRDRYGSRFGVVAPVTAGDQPQRWYLWDLDACGHAVFVVHSGFHHTSEAALAEWQAGVGGIAAAGTVLAPVDDPWLLAELMPNDRDMFGSAEVSGALSAEFFRTKRLAQAVTRAVRHRGRPPGGGLDAATAAAEFAAWLRATGRGGLPADLDELARELAESWCLHDIEALFTACSPHRVALFVPHVRGYYFDDVAEQLVALLPDWTRWLSERNATPPELADRCLPYAEGQPHPQLTPDDTGPDYDARVVE